MRTCFILLFLFCTVPVLLAQAPVNYDDVLLIINSNDTNSVAIGDYFAAKRQFRERNILRIDAPAKETITFAEFTPIRTQIEEYLIQSGLRDSINYFVTTKGVPLRVTHGESSDPRNASFDAEIMLILGVYAPHIGENTLFPTPSTFRIHSYFSKTAPYRRKDIVPFSNPQTTYDLYLTTRLIGLTKEDVFALIDRSGPFTLVNKDSALFVFDRDPRPIQLTPYDSNFALAGQLMASRGWNVLLNADSVYVTKQRNVIGYGSWGSNDHYDHLFTQFARPQSHWLPGSLAETYVSTSARNFIPGQTSGQSRIADLIAEGCTGASGYVFEPYTVALTWVNYLFDRYTRGFNLAESFYMSNPTFSWMAVVVGDPKTSIITEMPPIPTPAVSGGPSFCVGAQATIQAGNTLPGLLHWFTGDTAAVLAQGPPYDATHPLWLASGAQASFTPDKEGPLTVSLLNENFVGKGWAQTSLTIFPELRVTLALSSDTLYLDEDPTLTVNAIAPGAESFAWVFGDGGTATGADASHLYSTTGNFVVRCTASNAHCTTVEQRTVVVKQSRPGIHVQEQPIAFGKVQVLTDKSADAVIRNTLPSGIQLTTASVEGAEAQDFILSAVQLPLTIPSMGQQSLTVKFTPSALGTRRATLKLQFNGIADALEIALEGEGVSDPTDIGTMAGSVLTFDLLQNYPNPASASAVIPFALGRAAHVRLSIADATGRVHRVLIDEMRSPGLHSIPLQVSAYESGTWFIHLNVDGHRSVRAFSVLR
ncbi:MAG: TIGR03790 family protein [Bacteroidia bacterium]|nr:TIGR03790 family protein [Bacteroidia bacterium]